MPRDDIVEPQAIGKAQASEPQPEEPKDPKQSALAMGLEFSKKSLQAESLDTLFFILTNDIRLLVEFDRALLITHMGGESKFVAAGNQPGLKTKSKFYKEVTRLGSLLKNVDRAILLSAKGDSDQLSDEDFPREARDRLLAHMDSGNCSFLLCVPLQHNEGIVGHLLLEFHEGSVPNNIEILTLLSVVPSFASALAEKWLVRRKPDAFSRLFPDSGPGKRAKKIIRMVCLAGVLSLAIVFLFFLYPINYTVGGEAEIVPKDRNLAFVRIDGVVDRINVTEGAKVQKGQVLATLDRKELDHEIQTTRRQLRIFSKEITLLMRESDEEPSKLAESKLVELKRQSALAELNYLKWKSRFLSVKSPVSGIVGTKEVASLVGKRFQAGEPFCEITIPDDLKVVIYVPEDRISLVQKGQPAFVYLNSEPRKPYHLKVEAIAPIAEVQQRFGSVYRVSVRFSTAPENARVGMKGIGKIETGETKLYSVVVQRFMTRWNQFSLRF